MFDWEINTNSNTASIPVDGATLKFVVKPGVSNCYVFKSRLQEYAQKAGLTTPIYHTIKEGPSHQPVFSSTVVINDETYHSLTGFLNRKASEQSAAEIALIEISKTGTTDKSVSHPVHETGLCKNLLQEYAQKMNYAIPSYVCTKDEKKGRESPFSCTVDIGGIKYSGTAAKTKKEAELKAAKTALLAIQMSTPEPYEKSEIPHSESVYTVVPTKRKTPERPVVETEDNVKTNNKRKKSRFHKRRNKKLQTPSDVFEVKTDDSSACEVKESNRESVFCEVKDLKSNGDSLLGEVNELKSNRESLLGDVSTLESNGEGLLGELKDLKSNRESFLGEVKDLKSNRESLLGEVKNLKSNGESILGEVKDLKSNGEIVLGEVHNLKSNGESVLGEVKDLKSNREYVLGEVKDLKSNWEIVLGKVKDLKSNEKSVLDMCGNMDEDRSSVSE